MRYFTKPVPSDTSIAYQTYSLQELLDEYFHSWFNSVIVDGGQNFMSEEQCIQDWLVMNGAWESDSQGYHVFTSSASEGSMDFLTTFLAISLQNLNLFSFILGMVYTLLSVTIYSQKKLWFQIVLYVSIVALYFYFKSEAKNVPVS